MSRYLNACCGDKRKAMALYKLNLRLSQELFTVISCFEVALRNAIDSNCTDRLGADWLRDAAASGGIFNNKKCKLSESNISDAVLKLNRSYTHSKLVAEMGFGFWRFMFAQHQYSATGQALLKIFPAKPKSTPSFQYNNTYVFNQLALINDLRNRIAHHEPVCFQIKSHKKETTYARQHYVMIRQLFQWMCIDESSLLSGLEHVNAICDQIDIL